jgi:RNA polymerase sigma-70 factor (ECF subfamily)
MSIYATFSDESLIFRLQSGERKAFDEIYTRYWDKLFVTAANRVGDLHEAEDIVQEVMFNLWKRRETISLQSNLAAYLAVAVKYEVLNQLAKKKRQSLPDLPTTQQLMADYSTQQMLDFSALQQRLAVLVNALPEKCRLVFVLSREHGYSQKDIAKELDISENTVEYHIKNAVRALRDGIQHLPCVLFFIL